MQAEAPRLRKKTSFLFTSCHSGKFDHSAVSFHKPGAADSQMLALSELITGVGSAPMGVSVCMQAFFLFTQDDTFQTFPFHHKK